MKYHPLSSRIRFFLIKFRGENIPLMIQLLVSFLISLEQKYNQLFKKHRRYLHIIGDSHVFSFLDKKIKIHYLGPVTAHSLISNNSISQGRTKLLKTLTPIPSEELILMIFGEIDCRLHIYYQFMKHNQEKPIEYYISKTVANYIKFIKETRKLHPYIAILSILPTGEQSNIYNFPYYADRNTRIMITKNLNKQINARCKELSIPYINMYPKLIDHLGNRKMEYVLDSTHFNRRLAKLLLNHLQKNPVLRKFLA